MTQSSDNAFLSFLPADLFSFLSLSQQKCAARFPRYCLRMNFSHWQIAEGYTGSSSWPSADKGNGLLEFYRDVRDCAWPRSIVHKERNVQTAENPSVHTRTASAVLAVSIVKTLQIPVSVSFFCGVVLFSVI